MDTLIAFILAIVAGLLVAKKPFNIVITHKYEQPPVIQAPAQTQADVEKEKEKDAPVTSIDAVIQALNKMMGGDVDEHHGF